MLISCLDIRKAIDDVISRWNLSDQDLQYCHIISEYENKLHLFRYHAAATNSFWKHPDTLMCDVYLMCQQLEKFRTVPKNNPFYYCTSFVSWECIDFLVGELSITVHSFDYNDVYATILAYAVSCDHYEYIKTIPVDVRHAWCPIMYI